MKGNINITLDEKIIKVIKKIAKERHLNFSTTINQLLWEIIDLKEAKQNKEISKLVSGR